MFFDDEIAHLKLRKRARLREPPPIPETGWRPPTSFPNLSDAAVIGFDTETYEGDWDHGPGWARGPRGHIVGFSVAAQDRQGNNGAWYFPLRHELQPEYNLDATQCFNWLRDQLNTNIPKVGANLVYDIGWLSEENIQVKGQLHDVQFAEALIDESARVDLDNLGIRYAGHGKETNNLYCWLADAYSGNSSSEQRANIFRSPVTLAGPYAEADAYLPIRIFERQRSILHSQNLSALYDMECRLIPLLVRMRKRGVRIDLAWCDQLHEILGRDIGIAEKDLHALTGMNVNVQSFQELAPLFDHVGIHYPRTSRGNPSFEKEYLTSLNHPVANLVVKIRNLKKMRDTFVNNYFLKANVNGYIHCSFNSLRGDAGGTITGRFSSSQPNLQNIPARTATGKQIRKAFVAHQGDLCWRKIDYSQIEYRMLAHFATGNGADQLRQSYVDDPRTDYHDNVYNRVAPLLGYDLTDNALKIEKRRSIKNINFGLLYGQGEDELAYKAGLDKSGAKAFFKAYHEAAPYAKATMKAISEEVQFNGFITTILGRRCRFNLWEPNDYTKRGTPLSKDEALHHYGAQIRRAYDYKGTNYKFQGSAADVIKQAMAVAETSGVFDVIGDPLVQVHDELGFSQRDESPQTIEAFKYLDHVLETSTPCRVPIKVDTKCGSTWGDIE